MTTSYRASAMDGATVITASPAEVLAALRRCAAIGPFFAMDLDGDLDGDGDGGRWSSGDALLAPSAELSAAIEAVRRWASGTQPRVAASLFLMSYTGRLLSTAVAGALACGVLPDLRSHRWRYRPGHGVELSLGAAAGWRAEPDDLLSVLADSLLDGQVAATVRAVRALVPVSARLLWGNAASSLAGALGALAASRAVPPGECRRAGDTLLDRAPLRGTGSFPHPAGTPRQLEFRRRSCCLYYRLPDAALCADCVLRRSATM